METHTNKTILKLSLFPFDNGLSDTLEELEFIE